MMQDVRYAGRMLAKSPGFTIVAVLTLALGIGANAAIFSIVNAVLLRPLPYKDPGRLVQLWQIEAAPGTYPLTGPDYLAWQDQSKTLAGTSLYSWAFSYNASGAGASEAALVTQTQANLFSLLGVRALAGRTFVPGEDAPGKNHIAILSYGFWQRHFGGGRGALGSAIELNEESYAIVGVMPRGFGFGAATDVWTPMDMSRKNLGAEGSHQYLAIARLKPGVSVGEAQAELTTILKRRDTDPNDKVGATVMTLKEQVTKGSTDYLYMLLGAVALVLLIACANVANLLLARSSGRQREMAVRLAMGAGRWRLVRQLLTESVLLALGGAGLGLVGAWWCIELLPKLLPIPRANPVELNYTVLLFAIGLSVLVGVLFGLAPALRGSRLNLAEDLKSGGKAVLGLGRGERLLRDALIIGEVAISLALLVGAGLLLRTFARMRNADIGVDRQNILTFGVALPSTKYTTAASRQEFYDQLLEKARQAPGVQFAALSTALPLEGGSNGYVAVPGEKDPALASQLVEWNGITPEYFRVYGIPLLQGRDFNAEDMAHAAAAAVKFLEINKTGKMPNPIPPELALVSVINRAMARTFWKGQDAMGKVFIYGGVPVTVIGITGDVNEWGIRDKTIPQAYFPVGMDFAFAPAMQGHISLKTSVAPASVVGGIRGDVNALDSGLAVLRPRTMDEIVADSMQGTSVQAMLLGSFAGLGLLLAVVGIYGVMAYFVSERTHEIGIRMALGAQRGDVLRMILGQGARLAMIGVAIGIGGALELTRLMRSFLYGVKPTDPVTFVAVSVILLAVAVAACWIPARRAMRVDPMVALRYE